MLSLARIPVSAVGFQVAGTADHEGLAPPRCHNLYPQGLGTLAFHVQVAKGADMVDLDVERSMTQHELELHR